MTYRSAVREPLRTVIRGADAVLPGSMRASREVSRRSLWGALPGTAPVRPDGRRRLAVTVDLDYQADTDALGGVVEIMGRYAAPLSVFGVGALVDADPGPYAAALDAGHEIVNHTMTHPDNPVLNPDEEFWHLTVERMTQEIGRAQDVFDARLGVRPTGFRTPHFKDAYRLGAAVAGFDEVRWVSSALATRTPLRGQPYLAPARALAGEDLSHLFTSTGTDVLQIPLTACPEHRWSPFCSWHGIRAGGAAGAGMHTVPAWVALWRRMLAEQAPAGLAVVYLDPQDLMRDDGTAAAFDDMIRHAVDEGWDLTTLSTIDDVYRPALVQP